MKKLLIALAALALTSPLAALAATNSGFTNLDLGGGTTIQPISTVGGNEGDICGEGSAPVCKVGLYCNVVGNSEFTESEPANTCQISLGSIGSGTISNPGSGGNGGGGILPANTCTPACTGSQICQLGKCTDSLQTQVNADAQNAPVQDDAFVPLAPIPGLTADQNGNSFIGLPDLPNFLNNLYKYLIGLAAVLAVIEIIWGGLEIATQDNVSKHADGRDRIQKALLGLALILAPALVFGIINPSILNLSLSLPKLNTPAGTATSTPGTGSTVTAPKTGCTTAHTGPYMETAVCASQSDATSYACKNGLTLSVAGCKSAKPDGTCLDTSVTAYCAGKNTDLLFYSFTHTGGAVLSLVSNVTPKDEKTYNNFSSACQADGGTVAATLTTTANAFIIAHGWLVSDGCGSDSGVVVDTTEESGAACYTKTVSCNPPS